MSAPPPARYVDYPPGAPPANSALGNGLALFGKITAVGRAVVMVITLLIMIFVDSRLTGAPGEVGKAFAGVYAIDAALGVGVAVLTFKYRTFAQVKGALGALSLVSALLRA